MSNKIKAIKKALAEPEEYKTLVGSIVTTIGIITGKSELQVRKMYNNLKKDKKALPETVAGICNYLWSIYGDDAHKAARSNMVLVYDKLNIRTPLVTLVNEDGNILPLRPDGKYTGILMTAAAGSEYVDVEFLYDEIGEEIAE